MEVKEIIQSRLDAMEKLATLTNEELVELARNPEEFDKFISGYALSMNNLFVCHAYNKDGIIRKMINENMDRLDENEELSNNVFHVLKYLDSYSKESAEDRYEFTCQYEAIEENALCLDRFGASLNDFDKNAASIFRKMKELDFDSIKTDKYFLATVNFLGRHYPDYMSNTYMLPSIQQTLSHVDKGDFEDKKEYKKFKRAATKTLYRFDRSLSKARKERAKVLAKSDVPHGYKW